MCKVKISSTIFVLKLFQNTSYLNSKKLCKKNFKSYLLNVKSIVCIKLLSVLY